MTAGRDAAGRWLAASWSNVLGGENTSLRPSMALQIIAYGSIALVIAAVMALVLFWPEAVQ